MQSDGPFLTTNRKQAHSFPKPVRNGEEVTHYSPILAFGGDAQVVDLTLGGLQCFRRGGMECQLRFGELIQVLDRFGLWVELKCTPTSLKK